MRLKAFIRNVFSKKIEDKEEQRNELRPSPKMGDKAYYRDAYNKVQSFKVGYDNFESARALYDAQNYFLSKELAENVARAVKIRQSLFLFAREGDENPYETPIAGYTLTFNHDTKEFEVGATGVWTAVGDVVFETEERAWEAAEKMKKELTWYFTKAKYVH